MVGGIGSVGSVTVDPVCIKGTTPVGGAGSIITSSDGSN